LNKLNILFLALSIWGCHHSQGDKSIEVTKVDTAAKDIRIPKAIFDNIVADVKTESATVDPVYLFSPLQVAIQPESLISKIKPSTVVFSNGGGELDLNTHIPNHESFYIYFPEVQFEKMPPLEHLYFMSDYPQKIIDGEKFGTGCGKWMDLKSKFSEFVKPKIKLNSTSERYLYVAGGYYIFVFRKLNQVYLTHLHLTDSRYTNLKCPDSETKNEHN
jgi:hypothetical protein